MKELNLKLKITRFEKGKDGEVFCCEVCDNLYKTKFKTNDGWICVDYVSKLK